MKKEWRKLFRNSKVSCWIIFFLALLVRVAFYFWGTPIYYGSSGYQLSGDFGSWAQSIQNLVEHGQYTVAIGLGNGQFFRPPGYGFFLLPFYLLFGTWEDAYVWIAAVQIAMDALAAVILFNAVRILTANFISAWLAGMLYTFYFFALGWTPVLYPEAPSLFFLIAGFYCFVRAIHYNGHNTLLYWLAMGICWGIAALLRIQLLAILLVPALVIGWNYLRYKGLFLKPLLLVYAGILITYGLWPARNIINYGEPVFIQKLVEGGVWSKDYTSFFGMLKAIQVGHQPQFSQLLKQEAIHWPDAIQWTHEDSIKIQHAVLLMHTCGRATQRWKENEGYGKAKVLTENCDLEIAALWEDLTHTIKERHPYYTSIKVPLLNLSKAFFKNSLTERPTPFVVRVAFGLRSILIFVGLFGAVILLIGKSRDFHLVAILILAAVGAVYLSITFVARHVEMRYLLQADVLLLLPVAMMGGLWISRLVAGKKDVHTGSAEPTTDRKDAR